MAAGGRAATAAAACLLATAVAFGLLAPGAQRGDAFGTQEADRNASPATEQESEFPRIDWEHWRAMNPDVVGWVTVPGTAIDQPIVQARPEDDAFYLSHAVDGSPDAMGCAFLDAGCAAGLDAPNCVVYGHNWSGGRMFADFADFAGADFAKEHGTVLLQTPDTRRRLQVRCVEVADGACGTNVTAFDSAEELKAWFQARYAASRVKLEDAPVAESAPARVYTFCTCSDDESLDQRVLVYAYEG